MEEGSIFVLSGEELTLPSAEIEALVQTYSEQDKSTCSKLGRRVVYSELNDTKLISRVTDRAAYCRFGGKLLCKADNKSRLVSELDGSVIEDEGTFAVSSETLDKSACGEIGAMIKEKTSAKVSLENPDHVFQAEMVDGGEFVLGVSTQGFKKFSWRQRRPRARRFFLPSAIYPKLARLLVNLSRVNGEEGEYFLDPFCGTGSLLIESSVMGIKTIGIDLTRWIARGARLNLEGFSLDFESIIRSDSTHSPLPFTGIDAIATDVPYGRASSTKGKDTKRIIKEFTAAAGDALRYREGRFKKSKYCVLMHPSHVDFDYDTSAFELREQHLLYVHRNLTRAISVLRRRD